MLIGEYMGKGRLSPITSLLIKRDEFEYEKEVRVLFRNEGHWEDRGVRVPGKKEVGRMEEGDIIKLSIDPDKVIKSIKLHPEMKNEVENKKKIRSLGFDGDISKSTLFDDPNLQDMVSAERPIDFVKRKVENI